MDGIITVFVGIMSGAATAGLSSLAGVAVRHYTGNFWLGMLAMAAVGVLIVLTLLVWYWDWDFGRILCAIGRHTDGGDDPRYLRGWCIRCGSMIWSARQVR
jgi:hypothetical protein